MAKEPKFEQVESAPRELAAAGKSISLPVPDQSLEDAYEFEARLQTPVPPVGKSVYLQVGSRVRYTTHAGNVRIAIVEAVHGETFDARIELERGDHLIGDGELGNDPDAELARATHKRFSSWTSRGFLQLI